MALPAEAEARQRRQRYLQRVARTCDVRYLGRVVQVIGLTVEAAGPPARVGEVCEIRRVDGPPLLAEVVGFREGRTVLMPLGPADGVAPGSPVVRCGQPLQVGLGPGLLGRVLDGLGQPMDGQGPLQVEQYAPVDRPPPEPLRRPRIRQALAVGVRAIDALITCGRGQRVGIFAGSGVGKSTLLGMMARGTQADVVVVALVGERGREVREFLERDLGDARARSVVVVATSDQPAMVRVKAAFVATTVAEYFRDQGLDVLLLMDSVTRLAYAQREIGLAAGEPPTTRGYPPSVFAMLPRLLERAGTAEQGSITGFYTVLVDGDDLNDPVADAVRSILDGHVVLSRQLAERNHYPPVDVLASVSRLMHEVTTPEHRKAAARIRELMAIYRDVEDLVQVGAYVKGSSPEVDRALEAREPIARFLRQELDEPADWSVTLRRLQELAQQFGGEG